MRNATHVAALRRRLLTELDGKVPPTTANSITTQVKLQLRIFKVVKVELPTSRLVLKVWRRLQWFDGRLAFEPAQYGGMKTLVVHPGAGGLDNNLWQPHILLTNALVADNKMFETGAAWIRYDGRVKLDVPGTIDLTCRFSGLASFPFDELACPMELASWGLADDVIDLRFFDDPTDPDVLARGDRGCAQVSAQSAVTA